MAFSFTGFSDEASQGLADQIDVLKQVGWSAIELRGVDSTNVCDLDAAVWERTLAILRENQIQVVGFGGQIANWARPITSDFQKDVDELQRVAPRMKEAGTQFLRVMSYPNLEDDPWPVDRWKAEAIRRLRELSHMAEDLGVILGHENCSGYGGIGPDTYLELAAAIDSPAFKLIFDTGNNTLHDNDEEATWRFYEACRAEIAHVHIKAGKPGEDGEYVTCYPDEDPVQARILADLAATGYDGWISIEPHMAAAVHLGQEASGDEARRIWVEYAARIEKLAAAAQR
jgi:sugar phosphate isomerase/epimerase